MRNISIQLTEEQYQRIRKEIKKGATTNFNEETFSGFKIILNVIDGGISWIDFKMLNSVEIGDVNWDLN